MGGLPRLHGRRDGARLGPAQDPAVPRLRARAHPPGAVGRHPPLRQAPDPRDRRMLESYGEILAPHYTKGGLPGYYPPIKGKRPELIFNLYDPFNFFEGDSAEKKARGRLTEVNNGRLAMLGIFSIISEATPPEQWD